MLQINPFLNCTLYSRTVVHIAQNSQSDVAFINYVTK
jgi:hypothetical protein